MSHTTPNKFMDSSQDMSISDLKAILKEKGLSIAGDRQTLEARLKRRIDIERTLNRVRKLTGESENEETGGEETEGDDEVESDAEEEEQAEGEEEGGSEEEGENEEDGKNVMDEENEGEDQESTSSYWKDGRFVIARPRTTRGEASEESGDEIGEEEEAEEEAEEEVEGEAEEEVEDQDELPSRPEAKGVGQGDLMDVRYYMGGKVKLVDGRFGIRPLQEGQAEEESGDDEKGPEQDGVCQFCGRGDRVYTPEIFGGQHQAVVPLPDMTLEKLISRKYQVKLPEAVHSPGMCLVDFMTSLGHRTGHLGYDEKKVSFDIGPVHVDLDADRAKRGVAFVSGFALEFRYSHIFPVGQTWFVSAS